MGLEPAFARSSGSWPLPGMMPLEADDPRLAIPYNAFQAVGARGTRYERFVLTSDAALDQKPAEPLDIGRTAGKLPISRRWKAAIAGSCVLHAAIALCFLFGIDESAKIAGADQAGIAQLGNANEDATAAGEIDPAVAEVTLITMLDAKPVDIVAAEPGTDTQSVEPEAVEPVESTAEKVAPVEATPVEPEQPAQVALVAEPGPTKPAQQEQTAASVAETAPEILATDKVQPIEDDNAVAPSAQAVGQAVETAEETAPEAPAETVTEVPAETVAEPEPEETFETLAAIAPIPAPRPEAPAPKKPAEKVEKKQTPEEKPGRQRELKPTQKPAAGSRGNATADARRGQADGEKKGKTSASRGGSRQSAAGNAAVSNYPGKIVSKLRRALRYPRGGKAGKAARRSAGRLHRLGGRRHRQRARGAEFRLAGARQGGDRHGAPLCPLPRHSRKRRPFQLAVHRAAGIHALSREPEARKTMVPFSSFHAIAAARGDGLRPEILALIDRIAAESAVADIALHRGDAQIQAGPNPRGAIGTAPPEDVVRFPSATRDTNSRPGAKPAKRIV